MSSIGQTCAMVDGDAPVDWLEHGQRVRFVEEGRASLLATIEVIRGDWASIRDNDGNLWSARLDCLEPAEDTGEAA
ncbi:hypothetical protein IY145_10870 [Methylosinus sp. H3A]|uniref:hypothetical protein n=1 Tax=Methylosinus sp. H3A TaxID=2785786 RepID=UPI0018C26151|nr:hypothetical protein [Methylosinus sp. H3A]MBG0809881.1 hypothetical protein [Methylosinus sp. H3A]